MRDRREDSVIIVTGESGAGKTESAKHIMTFVTVVSPSTAGAAVEEVKKQLLNSSPVLESFGNAKTSRNDNSR